MFGRYVEGLLASSEPECRVGRALGDGIGKAELHLPGLRLVGLIADLDREFHGVAFAQETRGVRLNHDVFRRDHPVGEKSRAQVPIMGKPEKLPFGQRLWHRKLETDPAVAIRQELREKECSLLEVLPGGDPGQVELRFFSLRRLLGTRFLAEASAPRLGGKSGVLAGGDGKGREGDHTLRHFRPAPWRHAHAS